MFLEGHLVMLIGSNCTSCCLPSCLCICSGILLEGLAVLHSRLFILSPCCCLQLPHLGEDQPHQCARSCSIRHNSIHDVIMPLSRTQRACQKHLGQVLDQPTRDTRMEQQPVGLVQWYRGDVHRCPKMHNPRMLHLISSCATATRHGYRHHLHATWLHATC